MIGVITERCGCAPNNGLNGWLVQDTGDGADTEASALKNHYSTLCDEVRSPVKELNNFRGYAT